MYTVFAKLPLQSEQSWWEYKELSWVSYCVWLQDKTQGDGDGIGHISHMHSDTKHMDGKC